MGWRRKIFVSVFARDRGFDELLSRACLFIVTCCLISCASQSHQPESGTGLVLNVKDASAVSDADPWGVVSRFVISMSGEGMETVEVEVPGDATEAVIDVKPGDGRLLEVKAFNEAGAAVRADEIEDINIRSGEVKEVDVTLEAIPGFAYLSDGKSVENTRLVLKLYSDPGDELSVFVDENITGSGLVVPDSGILRFVPTLAGEGAHVLRVVSGVTGRESQKNVLLTDGTKSKPAPFFSSSGESEVAGVAWSSESALPLLSLVDH